MPALETRHYERRGKETVSAEAVTSHLHMAFVSWLSCDGKKKSSTLCFLTHAFATLDTPSVLLWTNASLQKPLVFSLKLSLCVIVPDCVT